MSVLEFSLTPRNVNKRSAMRSGLREIGLGGGLGMSIFCCHSGHLIEEFTVVVMFTPCAPKIRSILLLS